jgi:hypothetical protein
MKASEFAKAVTEMIQSEKDIIHEFIENEDWEGLEDEIFEYVSQGE